MTLNNHWSYAKNDNNYKPTAQIIRTFVETIANGGNLLLDVGPKADGTIPERQKEMLKELGEWIKRNREAVYETQAGLPPEHFYGPTLLSRDSSVIYLALFHKPQEYIALKGIQNKVKKIRVLNTDSELTFTRSGGAKWRQIPGILRITPPAEKDADKYVTVIAVELDGPVRLCRYAGKKLNE